MEFKSKILIEYKTEIFISDEHKSYYFNIKLNNYGLRTLRVPMDISDINEIDVLGYYDPYFAPADKPLELYNMTFNEDLHIFFKKIYKLVKNKKQLSESEKTVFEIFKKILKNIILEIWEK